MSGLAQAGYDVWVTGHGIPGWQPAGQPPLYLMSLGGDGRFSQTALAIQQAASSGKTATITTQAPHGLQNNETVFVAGAGSGYDGSFAVTVTTPTTFKYSTATADLPQANAGTVYRSSLLASAGIASAVSASFNSDNTTGLATLTTAAPHGLSVGQTVEVSGVSVAGYDGVFSVGQVPTATTFQVSYSAAAALAPATGGTLNSVALSPVRVSRLPRTGITLDDGLTNISSKLLFFVAPADAGPSGLPFSGNGVTPTDPPTPPSNPAQIAPTSVFDIVEFAYLPWGATEADTVATITTTSPHGLSVNHTVSISGVADAAGTLIPGYNLTDVTVTGVPTPQSFTFTASAGLPKGGAGAVTGTTVTGGKVAVSGGFSTFDVSAVDGLAIPMTLTADQVKPGSVDSVGIRLQPGFTREAIGHAFLQFMAADPLGHVDPANPASRDFSKLLYDAHVTATPITGVSAAWSANVATFTYSSSTPILPFEWVTIDGFTGDAAGFNSPSPVQVQSATATTFTVTNTYYTTGTPTGSGGTVTPLLFQTPALPYGQFAAIAAPKDWLGNQQPTPTKAPPGLASQDSLATFWDTTIENFFQIGNTLSIYLGKETTGPIYSGSSDGSKYTLTNGLNTYDFPKPTGGSLANALYVWSQPNPGSDDQGLLQDQIWQALCRGVALDGVNPAPIDVSLAESTTFIKVGAANPQGVATIKTASPHGLSTGASITISGISNADYNGTKTITRIDDTTFTFPYTFTAPAAVINSATSTFDNGTVTVTIATNGLWQTPAKGQIVYVQLTSGDASYNGTHTVSEVDEVAHTFKYTFPGSAALPAGVGGTVWGPLWADGTGGTVDAGGSSTAWNDPTNWYTQHVSTAFPSFQSVYCPYSKFLHYSTLTGTVDRTGTTSIYLGNAAYGFGEDENPIGNPYTGPLVPSKLDGTVFDESSVRITVAPWVPAIVSGDFNGDGLTDVASREWPSGSWTAWLTSTTQGGPPTQVTMAAWSTNDTWSDFLVGDFTGDGTDDVAGRNQTGAWYVIAKTGGTEAAPTFTSSLWIAGTPTIRELDDFVVGDFDGDGHDDIAGRRINGTWWYIHDSAGSAVASKMARWTTNMAWSMVVVGNFTGDASGREQIAGRNSNGVWWMISYDPQQAAFTNTSMTPWSRAFTWADAVVGDFTGDGRDDIAARRLFNNADPSKKLNSWFVISCPSTTFQTSNVGKWPGNQTWLDIRAGDFLGNGLAGIAGRSASTGDWQVLQKSGGSYSSTNFGGGWSPAGNSWQVFAGLFNPAESGPHKKTGLLGRAMAGNWVVSLSDGSSFTTTPVTFS